MEYVLRLTVGAVTSELWMTVGTMESELSLTVGQHWSLRLMLIVGTRYKRYKKLYLVLVSIKQILLFLTLESELRLSAVESDSW